jgi:ABC-2 type transport system permease protein
MSQYSNFRALRALIKASLQAIFRSPSAVVFSIAFPLIFILVFGFIGGGKGYHLKVTSAYGSDTASPFYGILHQVSVLKWVDEPDSASINKALKEDDVVAAINIVKQPVGASPRYKVILQAPSAEQDKVKQLQSIITSVAQAGDPEIQKLTSSIVDVDVHFAEVRDYKMIDFILPGQLGFSLLAAGVFGTAFVFFNLRQTLVLKRFFATPVSRQTIVLGEGIARMIFQLMGSIVIIGLGYFAFGFTLIHGWVTFLEMLLLCMIGLMMFMGFGFIISSIAKSESSIPPLANIVTLPQFLLAGTFFPIDNFPNWLQPFCKVLPLTYLNNALRSIAFDGAGLLDIKMDILIVLGWGVAVYIIAARVFKWE